MILGLRIWTDPTRGSIEITDIIGFRTVVRYSGFGPRPELLPPDGVFTLEKEIAVRKAGFDFRPGTLCRIVTGEGCGHTR
jgi:hypothetical protein